MPSAAESSSRLRRLETELVHSGVLLCVTILEILPDYRVLQMPGSQLALEVYTVDCMHASKSKGGMFASVSVSTYIP